jgi:hypothetical protein
MWRCSPPNWRGYKDTLPISTTYFFRHCARNGIGIVNISIKGEMWAVLFDGTRWNYDGSLVAI